MVMKSQTEESIMKWNVKVDSPISEPVPLPRGNNLNYFHFQFLGS